MNRVVRPTHSASSGLVSGFLPKSPGQQMGALFALFRRYREISRKRKSFNYNDYVALR
jgi:hypothetical protein